MIGEYIFATIPYATFIFDKESVSFDGVWVDQCKAVPGWSDVDAHIPGWTPIAKAVGDWQDIAPQVATTIPCSTDDPRRK